MFERMPRLVEGSVTKIHLFPAALAERVPDVIVVEDEVERLMWIVLSSLHVAGGERVRSDTSVLQAACVDATIVPFLEDRPNMSFGCYGCRDATDVRGGEALIGFPARWLGPDNGPPRISEPKGHAAVPGEGGFFEIGERSQRWLI